MVMKYKDDLKNFPTEVVEKMLYYQVKQGNEKNVKVFKNLITEDKKGGGFNWHSTEEGTDFWRDVLLRKKYDIFFKKYPKRDLNMYYL